MEKVNEIRFLNWLINRLVYKHQYTTNDIIITELYNLIKTIQSPPIISIKDADLDKIISKYYVDFNLEKSEDMNIGYSEEERKQLRLSIKMLIDDVIHKNVPKNFTIKG